MIHLTSGQRAAALPIGAAALLLLLPGAALAQKKSKTPSVSVQIAEQQREIEAQRAQIAEQAATIQAQIAHADSQAVRSPKSFERQDLYG